jgi:hypothetical protein
VPIPEIEYVGFRSGETSRDYRLLIRHPGGQCDEFVLAIRHEAFLSHRVRYQDAAEICFLKLRRVLHEWITTPGSTRPATRQDVTDADLVAYREAHAPKPQRRRAPPPVSGAARRPR